MTATEPLVAAADVRRALERARDWGTSVDVLVERAGDISRSSVYRVLDGTKGPWLELDEADRLLIAADGELRDCELRWPDSHESG